MSLRFAAFSVLLACACATAQPVPSPPKTPAPEDAIAYYPLEAGWKWAYDVESPAGNLLAVYSVTQVLPAGETRFVVVSAGEDRLGYEVVLSEGIRRKEGQIQGDFIIKSPVRLDARWTIATGQARIVAVGKTVETPAGRFENCATVEENKTEPDRVIRTTFAPGVGPVAVDQLVHDPATGQYTSTLKARLRGVTRPGEDPFAQ